MIFDFFGIGDKFVIRFNKKQKRGKEMGQVSFGKIGNVNPTKPMKYKLKVTDYIFTYQNKDLKDAYLEYYFDSVMNVTYQDGKRVGETYSPLINFELSGTDDLFNVISFSFMVHFREEELKKLTDKPTKINKNIIESETYLTTSYEESNGPLDIYLNESMYHDTANFFVAKLEDKKYVFKGSVPSESIFFWFTIDFHEHEGML